MRPYCFSYELHGYTKMFVEWIIVLEKVIFEGRKNKLITPWFRFCIASPTFSTVTWDRFCQDSLESTHWDDGGFGLWQRVLLCLVERQHKISFIIETCQLLKIYNSCHMDLKSFMFCLKCKFYFFFQSSIESIFFLKIASGVILN